MQRYCRWWKLSCAKGEAQRGQDFAAAQATATNSAGAGKTLAMELVTTNSPALPVFATSTASQIKERMQATRAYIISTYIYVRYTWLIIISIPKIKFRMLDQG